MANSKKYYSKKKFSLAKYLKEAKIDLKTEKPIILDGKESDYTITIEGKVFSHKGVGGKKRRELVQSPQTNGYYTVNLMHEDGRERAYKVHRLVATYFIPNPENKPQVNHINGDKSKNNADNLEWVTEKENVQHAYSTGLAKGKVGETHHAATITDDIAEEICKLLEKNENTYKEIAEMTGSTYTIVKKIKNGLRWTHISSKYDFSNYIDEKRRLKMRKEKLANETKSSE